MDYLFHNNLMKTQRNSFASNLNQTTYLKFNFYTQISIFYYAEQVAKA